MNVEGAAYADKFEALKDRTYFPHLDAATRRWIGEVSSRYRFTFQELRKVTEIARDLEMWQEEAIRPRWQSLEDETPENLVGLERKKRLLKALERKIDALKRRPKVYTNGNPVSQRQRILQTTVEQSARKIFGDCPVASPKTVCCNLKTIDAVQNCVFECSYCTIQTFYGPRAVFDRDLAKKLSAIELDPNRFYHIGTGQASDSLVWGNKNGILDDLCEFARENPNILLEFKTKSSNVSYFLNHDVPVNVVCSWSLNTETIVSQEEHFTAPLDQRLRAARDVADRGIKVAFHFHPIVYYEGWDQDYPELARRVQESFDSEEVLFISFGSVTFIKPVIHEIRRRGQKTKILQMEMVPDPHGKLTYPDEVKLKLFRTMYESFSSWRRTVYMYLCMERADIWDQVFGWHYPTNEVFESNFCTETMRKIGRMVALKYAGGCFDSVSGSQQYC
ncbi:MAG: hypothetical protein A3G87_03920 [Omnitrophica bacterium RIFCSPLOWO2_12_FULL_50_11]|nr:MAG: hypothetical protein A3G87_03920 [Omnitrophica bacterium RIFCSPLOWO2_12_FULL_50_11]